MFENTSDALTKLSERQGDLNTAMAVHGQRLRLSLHGRTIDAVYYAAWQRDEPLLVALHSGGFLFGGCALEDARYDEMRRQWGVNVLSVGYRTGPEHPFPEPLNDVYETVGYMLEHETQFHFDADRIILHGEGAGAALALSSCILAYRRKEYRIACVVAVDPLLSLPAMKPTETVLTEEALAALYLKSTGVSPRSRRDPLLLPAFAASADFDPQLHAVLLLPAAALARKRGEKLVGSMQTAGACVEWRIEAGPMLPPYELTCSDISAISNPSNPTTFQFVQRCILRWKQKR